MVRIRQPRRRLDDTTIKEQYTGTINVPNNATRVYDMASIHIVTIVQYKNLNGPPKHQQLMGARHQTLRLTGV